MTTAANNESDYWLLSLGAAVVAGTWYALGPDAAAQPAVGAIAQVEKQAQGKVLGATADADQQWLKQAIEDVGAAPKTKEKEPAPEEPEPEPEEPEEPTKTEKPTERPRRKRRKRASFIRFAPPTSASSELALTSAINTNTNDQIPEPDDTLLPGHDFPEIQGKPTDMKLATAQKKTEVAALKPDRVNSSLSRFPSVNDPPGCTGIDHCINFGGKEGFPYNAASEEERAAFRAVIGHYARKGDSVTISYMENTATQIPPSREQARAACGLWKGIEPDVDVSACVANAGYIKDRLHSRNRAHHTVLTDLLRRSWASAPGREAPRTGVEVPRLDPDFREKLESERGDGGKNKVMPIKVEGAGTVPYLDALKDALDPERLQKEENVIHAITQQCDMVASRSLHMDELSDMFMRNYPQSEQEPSEGFYLRQSDDYGLVANAFEEDAKATPGEWTGTYKDDPGALPQTNKK